jgi:hypothetical protein
MRLWHWRINTERFPCEFAFYAFDFEKTVCHNCGLRCKKPRQEFLSAQQLLSEWFAKQATGPRLTEDRFPVRGGVQCKLGILK